MATYGNGRRAPNVSQYIANLNTIPTQQEATAQNDFDLSGDGLDFLNTEFFDFDNSTFDANGQFARSSPASARQHAPMNGGDDFQFTEFPSFAQANFSQSPASIAPNHEVPLSGPFASPSDAFAVVGDKRKISAAHLQPVSELEEQSRQAVEEDKRRRNTAASARFRVKKKQREQALEKQAKEMSDKVQQLEDKVQKLEMENKWLKGLITEKSDMKGVEEQHRSFVEKAQGSSNVERSHGDRNDGVGTDVAGEA